MQWSWGFVTTVVADVEAASEFYAGALGLPAVGEGEFSAIGAEGRMFALGANASVAVVSPVGEGPARRTLDEYRGGLCHVGLAVEQAPADGEAVRSPLGDGRLVGLAGELALELVEAQASKPAGTDTAGSAVAELDHVAVVVPDLDAAAARLNGLGLDEDPAASRWHFPQLQTRNAVFPSRSGYLEINQAFTADGIFGSLAVARGAAIVGLTLTVTDIDATVTRLRDAGVGVSDPTPVLARNPAGEELDLGLSAVVSMKQSHGARLFLFAPSSSAPHYGPTSSAVS
jgi:catechol 2,3-dioxygenase-like lactoylglutathione lyase family enzyme